MASNTILYLMVVFYSKNFLVFLNCGKVDATSASLLITPFDTGGKIRGSGDLVKGCNFIWPWQQCYLVFNFHPLTTRKQWIRNMGGKKGKKAVRWQFCAGDSASTGLMKNSAHNALVPSLSNLSSFFPPSSCSFWLTFQ